MKKVGKDYGLTEKDFNEFLSAAGDKQWQILLDHAQKNQKIIKIRRLKQMEQYNDHRCEEINNQFEEFCRTKGIAAKFKVAFGNMAENARKQKAADKANFEEIKRRSAEANPEFTELLHTKGFVAKIRLIGANLKKSCKEAPHRTAVAVDNITAQTKADIAKAKAGMHAGDAGYGLKNVDLSKYSADDLSREFNEFLKLKGLDGEYTVEVTGEDQ